MPLFKKIIVLLVVASLLAVAFFSFAMMSYTSDGQMAGDCPLAVVDSSLCPQGILNVTVHHLSAYHSFFNIPLSFGLIIALIIFTGLFVFSPLLFSVRLDDPPLVYFSRRKITHWLALLENSPA